MLRGFERLQDVASPTETADAQSDRFQSDAQAVRVNRDSRVTQRFASMRQLSGESGRLDEMLRLTRTRMGHSRRARRY